MELQNKLGLTGSAFEAAEERVTKRRAKQLFEQGMLDRFETDAYRGLQAIHRRLFEDIHDFAGQTRRLNLSKGSFRFASALYLDDALVQISAMPQKSYEQIIAKYGGDEHRPPLPGGQRPQHPHLAGGHTQKGTGHGGGPEPRRPGGLSPRHGAQPGTGYGNPSAPAAGRDRQDHRPGDLHAWRGCQLQI